MQLRWHSFLIPGVAFNAIGIGGIAVAGLTPLTVGALIVGFLLELAAVIAARGQDPT